MNAVSRDGAVHVGTCTRQEWEQQHDTEPVHFVAPEGFRWSDD